ncbi:hypothetical protein Cpir12675_003863 [Ceratocystis pirilliformis]|uniref:Uncharacterized protein n=1 Tax=Ceratocystis pirilliformis TaxID=259994 RepID=A0ABR3Z3K2_9PEZI
MEASTSSSPGVQEHLNTTAYSGSLCSNTIGEQVHETEVNPPSFRPVILFGKLDHSQPPRSSVNSIDSSVVDIMAPRAIDPISANTSTSASNSAAASPVSSASSSRSTTTVVMVDTHEINTFAFFGSLDSPKTESHQRNLLDSLHSPGHFHDDPPEVVPSEDLFSSDNSTKEASLTELVVLKDLTRIVRLGKYQQHIRLAAENHLRHYAIADALSTRFLRCAAISQRSFANFFYIDDAEAFADLRETVEYLHIKGDEYSRLADAERGDNTSKPVDGYQQTAIDNRGNLQPVPSFLAGTSPDTRQTLLSFISKIRSDPDYLAECLCSLTTSELIAMTKPSQDLGDVDSILPQQAKPPLSRGTGRTPSSHLTTGRPGPKADYNIKRMMSFHRHDPIYTLMYTCFTTLVGFGSAEDERRLNIWAQACARLISARTGLEPVFVSILNAWTLTCDWPGKTKIEWYLMRILEDGAFILDRAEDQQGTRFNLRNWTPRDDEAAQEFYDKAVGDLFKTVIDAEGGGIPESFLDFSNEVLKRIEPNIFESTRAFFCRWLFQNLILNVVTRPEGYGIMSGYHITTYGREKILQQVAHRALGYATSILNGGISDQVVPPHIRQHIATIIKRFHGHRIGVDREVASASKLQSACPIVLQKEEECAYLVISPRDLVTMVETLWPERTLPCLSTLRESQKTPPRAKDKGDQSEEGAALRRAIRDLKEIVGFESAQGTTDPYSDQWDVLFVSLDGRELSTQLVCDFDDNSNDKAVKTGGFAASNGGTDQTDEGNSHRFFAGDLRFGEGYLKIKTAIMKLLVEHEIPITTYPSPSTLAQDYQSQSQQRDFHQSRHPPSTHDSLLVQMLKAALDQSECQGNFSSSLLYFNGLRQLAQIPNNDLFETTTNHVLSVLSQDLQTALCKDETTTKRYKLWISYAKQTHGYHKRQIEQGIQRLRALRDKMWYVSEVVHSGPYTNSRGICVALKAMGRSQRVDYRTRINSNSPYDSTHIHLAEFQMLDLLAASDSHGGPNKLSDDQVENTLAWLKSRGIENICKGEERIHRFCWEIESCVSKLVGETLSDAPVLWSSELFACDQIRLEENTTKPQASITALSPGSQHSGIFSGPTRSCLGGGIPHQGHKMQENHSKHGAREPTSSRSGQTYALPAADKSKGPSSFTAPRSLFQKPPLSRLTGTSYAHSTSSTDTTNVFSTASNLPFRNYSSPAEASSARCTRPEPISIQALMPKSPQASMEKLQFLEQLRETLIGLLLSDLGNLVYSRGSETDDWFADIGQQCIERIQAKEAGMSVYQSRQGALARQSEPSFSSGNPASQSPRFPFDRAYKSIFHMFSIHPNPYTKLDALHRIAELVTISAAMLQETSKTPSRPTTRPSLQILLQTLADILRDPQIRPQNLFMGLQFIASLVPAKLLKNQVHGLCFWDFAAAAISIKMDASTTMLHWAEAIIQADALGSNTRPSDQYMNGLSQTYTMADAARMLAISAKEGVEPAAQRELALLYMVRPDLLGRVLIPFSKTCEVFRQALMDIYGSSSGTSSCGGPASSALPSASVRELVSSSSASLTSSNGNPIISSSKATEQTIDADRHIKVENIYALCLAVHWMEAAQSGGDKLANDFMNQRAEDLV